MALETFRLYKTGAAEPYATIDDDGNINATGELRVDGVAVAAIDTSGHITINDTFALKLGTGGTDDQISASGTATTWTHVTGDLTIDNQLVTGSTIFLLGTDTTATDFQVQNNSAAALFSVTPASATQGTIAMAGKQVNTSALTATGTSLAVTTTLNSATGVASGIHSAIATLTTVHSAGIVAAYKASITSLAGDTGGDFCALQIVSVDGGGTTPVHCGIYCDDPLDAFIKVAADGDGGFVVGATMTISPETSAESGYIRCRIGATVVQIPFYNA